MRKYDKTEPKPGNSVEHRNRPSTIWRAFHALVLIIAIVSVVGNFLLYKHTPSQRVLIRVNDHVITRKDLDDRVDFLYGRGLLSQMIWSILVRQEATRRHCMPKVTDVNEALDDLDRTDPKVVADARLQDPALSTFRDSLLTSLALRNLQIVDIKVTPSEVQQYYDTHRSLFAVPEMSLASAVMAKNSVIANEVKSMFADNVSLDVISMTPGAKVIDYNPEVVSQLPVALANRINHMSAGAVEVYPVAEQYLVVRMNSLVPSYTPPFDKLKRKVEIAAKLAKAPTERSVLTDLRARAIIVAESDKFVDAIPQAAMQ